MTYQGQGGKAGPAPTQPERGAIAISTLRHYVVLAEQAQTKADEEASA